MGQRFQYKTYGNNAAINILPEVMGAAAKNVYANKPPAYSMYQTLYYVFSLLA